MTRPDRKTARLRFGRCTQQGAFYFVTACTKNRESVLIEATNGTRTKEVLQMMHSSGDMDLAAATIMPDHVHLLFALGTRLEIGQVIGKFKTLARNMGKSSWQWQQDGFEHRLRNIESVEDYGFYIFMNPYQAGLCSLQASWPWWICPHPSIFHFAKSLGAQRTIPPSWLDLSDQTGRKITAGD